MKTKTKLIENKAKKKNSVRFMNVSRSPFFIYLWPETIYGRADELGIDIVAISIVDEIVSYYRCSLLVIHFLEVVSKFRIVQSIYPFKSKSIARLMDHFSSANLLIATNHKEFDFVICSC